MEGTPADVAGVPVFVDVPDTEVKSVAPLSSQIEQGALGYYGADFVPGTPVEREERVNPNTIPPQVFYDPNGEDYVPPDVTSIRKGLRERLIDRLTKQILEQNKVTAERYARAEAFIAKYSQVEFDSLSADTQRRLRNAIRIMEEKPPITEEEARRRATVQAWEEAVG